MGRTSQKFDRQLFALKLSEPARQMQIESLTSNKAARSAKLAGSVLIRIVDSELAVLRKWLETVDRMCREVWQTQGETITPEFVREILTQEAMTAIGARVGVTNSHLDRTAAPTHEDPYAARHHLAMEVNRLKADVANRHEIEARELEYQKALAAQGSPQSQLDELGGIRGLSEDARRDTILWLQADPSAEERVHVLAIQGLLANLARIIERRMERRGSPQDDRQWSEAVTEVLLLLDKAREVRGHIVGKSLGRLAERLPRELPGPQPRRVSLPPSPPTSVGGRGITMNQSDLWKQFGAGFEQLAREEERIERAAPKDRLLRAYCDYNEHPEIIHEKGKPGQGWFCLLKTPETGLWMYSDGVSENFQERFRALAARAGVSLGSPNGTDMEDFWLHRLYLDLCENNSKLLLCDRSQRTNAIRRVCEASATFCARLERKALVTIGAEERSADTLENMTNAAASPFSHSEDYRTVTVRGQTHLLTPRQAQMIEILHEARKNRTPEVSNAHILERLDTPNGRWQDTWKSNKEARDALIQGGARKGTLRLNL
jgi:hypothetical protein